MAVKSLFLKFENEKFPFQLLPKYLFSNDCNLENISVSEKTTATMFMKMLCFNSALFPEALKSTDFLELTNTTS